MSAIRQLDDRRIGGIVPTRAFTVPAPVPFMPPRNEWPDWVQHWTDTLTAQLNEKTEEIATLKQRLEKVEQKNMEQEKSLILTQYGEPKELATLKERVKLVPYGANLDETGRAMVAQICWLLDWNPFFDMHAFTSGGKLVLMPDYKKLLSMAKEQQRINHDSRPMTDQERIDVGLREDQIGYVTEVKEIDTFLEFAKAGVASEYKPIIGYGVYSKGDNIPNTWTSAMVARKRSIRNALYQLTNYKIVTKRFRDALMQIGAIGVSEEENGFVVDVPTQPEALTAPAVDSWWSDPKQRQRFWIAAKVISAKKDEIAAALTFKIDTPEDSSAWHDSMAQFPDLENAIAYVNVCAENIKQQAAPPDTVTIDEHGEVLTTPAPDSTPVVCTKCKERPATNEGPFPALCGLCAKKAADTEAAKEG